PMLLDAADVLVYPFGEITQSGSLMTGLPFGKAILATALPAFQEVLRHGETARLAPHDDADAFAAELALLTADQRERERLAGNAAAAVVSWENIARKTRECYEAVLAGAGSPLQRAEVMR